MGSDGFEPPKASPTDLQSAPFSHSGNFPNILKRAESQIRTEDPEITNHVLWPTELIRLIYFSVFLRTMLFSISARQRKAIIFICATLFFQNFTSPNIKKKWVSYLRRTATTTYPCCLPTLGDFSRSWSHRTYPAQK